MKAHERNYVVFYSPGTVVSEETSKPIEEWDVKVAVKMAMKITERHGATPYGFRFERYKEVDPMTVEGTKFKVEPKKVAESGVYFITGEIRTAAQVLAGTDPREDILRSNVEINKIKVVVTNKNSFMYTGIFYKDDFVVDLDGEIIVKGTDLERLPEKGMMHGPIQEG